MTNYAFPMLKIVPLSELRLHEHVDPARLPPLMAAIERDRCLKNPPLVLPLGTQDPYVVLDGATRTLAFRELGYMLMMVQVIRPQIDAMELRTWNQVVMSAEVDALLRSFEGSTILEMARLGAGATSKLPKPGTKLLDLCLPDGRCWSVSTMGASTEHLVEGLNHVFALVREHGGLERTDLIDVDDLPPLFPNFTALLRFHEVQLSDVLQMAREEKCMPAGLTRFIISPRALRVNFPLALLQRGGDLGSAQSALLEWIQERMRGRQVRLYQESVYIFDE